MQRFPAMIVVTITAVLPVLILERFVTSPPIVSAQGWGPANTYKIADPDAKDGDVMALNPAEGTFIRAQAREGEQVFGVYVQNPTVVLRTDPTFVPIVREGDVTVNVSTLGGPIVPGDALVPSQLPGKAQKSTTSGGTSFGTALGSFTAGEGVREVVDGQEVWSGQVTVALKVGANKSEQVETAGGFVQRVKQLIALLLNTLTKGEDVARIIRFIVAGIVAAITVFMSFTLFGRNISKGIEAIGRNPLAKLSIQTMIIVNIVLIAAVTIGGVLLTLVIIKF